MRKATRLLLCFSFLFPFFFRPSQLPTPTTSFPFYLTNSGDLVHVDNMSSHQHVSIRDPPNPAVSGADERSEDRLETWKHEFGKALDRLEAHGDATSRKAYTEFADPGLQVFDQLIPLPLQPQHANDVKKSSFFSPID